MFNIMKQSLQSVTQSTTGNCFILFICTTNEIIPNKLMTVIKVQEMIISIAGNFE